LQKGSLPPEVIEPIRLLDKRQVHVARVLDKRLVSLRMQKRSTLGDVKEHIRNLENQLQAGKISPENYLEQLAGLRQEMEQIISGLDEGAIENDEVAQSIISLGVGKVVTTVLSKSFTKLAPKTPVEAQAWMRRVDGLLEQSRRRFNVAVSGGKASKAQTKTFQEASKEVKQFLGEGYRTITNRYGDKVFVSKDGLRKIRFDFKNPRGDRPHAHVEVFQNGRWRDSVPGSHRVYPKQ